MDTEITLEWLKDFSNTGLYVFLFFSAFLENLFPPWPGDTFIILSGFLAAQSKGNIYLCFLSSWLGSLGGAALMYYAGEALLTFFRNLHDKSSRFFLHRFLKPLFDTEKIEKVKYYFQRWGVFLVLFSRFSAGLRFFISIVAGISKMNFPLFLLCFSLGAMLWNALLLLGGWQLKENWNEILTWLQLYNTLIISILLVLLLVYLIHKRKKRKPQTP